MQLHYIDYFVQSVECGSLNRAARKLDISPQTLCAGVAAFERTLGYPLLERTSSGVFPTEKGSIVYEDALKFREVFHRWLAMAKQDESRPSITVKIGASTALMRWLVPQVVIDIRTRYPHIMFNMYESFAEDVFSNLVDQHMIGVITGINDANASPYTVKLAQNGMLHEEGPDDSFAVVINKESTLASKAMLCLTDLAEFHLVFNPKRDKHFVYRSIFRHFGGGDIMTIPEQENLLRIIAMDKGMATVLPRSALLSSEKWMSNLKAMQVEDFPMPGRIWLIYPERMISSEMEVLASFRSKLAEMERMT